MGQTETTMRRSFQFTVAGPQQTGVVYVTLSFTDLDRAKAQATKIAAKRSGDPAPVLVRVEAPRR
jgi:hypothetical protein